MVDSATYLSLTCPCTCIAPQTLMHHSRHCFLCAAFCVARPLVLEAITQCTPQQPHSSYQPPTLHYHPSRFRLLHNTFPTTHLHAHPYPLPSLTHIHREPFNIMTKTLPPSTSVTLHCSFARSTYSNYPTIRLNLPPLHLLPLNSINTPPPLHLPLPLSITLLDQPLSPLCHAPPYPKARPFTPRLLGLPRPPPRD